jgi:UDP-N-acetyl-alpha-D-muramoyl-L-alanyl-L-glutamate epimerase
MTNPRTARVFHFLESRYLEASGEACLEYRVDDGPVLVERIVFPRVALPDDGETRAAFTAALHLLHWIAGVSYWKAGLAPEIRFEGPGPTRSVQRFLTEVYSHGLAEFAFVNQVDARARLNLPHAPGESPPARYLDLPERALVAMGGGKDSLVGLDLARKAGLEVQPWCIGESPLIGETVAAAGLDVLRIRRHLAPELRAMNEAGAWNGHVPVTAINSAIGVCAALLNGFRHVVFSNERSADEATRTGPDGMRINHQYSKSSAFEASFRAVVSTWVAADLEYFSILRPYSELDIVRQFSTMERFHGVYSSCNRNFHLTGPAIGGRWCGGCPKCRFAALSLAVFLPPGRVRAILGAELLDDPAQEHGFRALCGLGADKPFECVGETGESRAALAALALQPGWRDRAVVRLLAPELANVAVPPLASLLRPSPSHFIPARIAARLPGLEP